MIRKTKVEIKGFCEPGSRKSYYIPDPYFLVALGLTTKFQGGS
jgi:hypothetical protein